MVFENIASFSEIASGLKPVGSGISEQASSVSTVQPLGYEAMLHLPWEASW